MKKLIEPTFEMSVFENAVYTAEKSDKAVDIFEIVEHLSIDVVQGRDFEELDDTFNHLVERIKDEGALNVWEDIQTPFSINAQDINNDFIQTIKEYSASFQELDPESDAALFEMLSKDFSKIEKEFGQFGDELERCIYENNKDGTKNRGTQEGGYKAAGIKFQRD